MSWQDGAAGSQVLRPRPLLVPLLVLAAVLGLLWARPVNHDSSWLLYATGAWLDGKRLYVDLIEPNPPLVFFLHVPAVLLARVSGVSPGQAFYLTVLSLLLVALLWVHGLTRHRISPMGSMFLLGGLALALTMPFLFNIGQREHLMMILALPYVAGFAAGKAGEQGRADVWRAAFAAPGFFLKPYFIVIPLSLVLGRVALTGRWKSALSADTLVFALLGMSYVAAAWWLVPQYFEKIVPVAIEVYPAYRNPAVTVLFFSNIWLVAIMAILLAGIFGRKLPEGIIYLLLAVFGAYASYFLQMNGFRYHAEPAFALMLMVLAWAAADSPVTRQRFQAVVGYGTIALVTFVPPPRWSDLDGRLDTYFAYHGVPEKMLILSADLLPFFPAIDRHGYIWAGRFRFCGMFRGRSWE